MKLDQDNVAIPRYVLNAGSLGELSRRLLPNLQDHLNADAGSVLVRHNGVLVVHTSFGLKENRSQEARIPVGVGVTGEAALTGRRQWVPDVSEVENHIEGIPGSTWEFCVPLEDKSTTSQVVIDLESNHAERPSDNKRETLVEFLETIKRPLLNLAEKDYLIETFHRDHYTDLLDGEFLIETIKQDFQRKDITECLLFVVDVKPTTADSTVQSFTALRTELQQVEFALQDLSKYGCKLARLFGTMIGVYVPEAKPGDVSGYRRAIYDALEGVAQVNEINWSHTKTEISTAEELLNQSFPGHELNPHDNGDQKRVADLHNVLDDGSIRLVHQPILNLDSEEVIGREVLVRGPEGSELESPQSLFDLARKNRVTDELDALITSLCLERIPFSPNERIFLNVERSSFSSSIWRDSLHELLEGLGDEQKVCLEITEHSTLTDFGETIDSLRRETDDTLEFAIDDFGTGSSNFEAVLDFKPDLLKIDRSLIQEINGSFGKKSLIESIVTFSRTAGITILAEGIEHQSEKETLKSLGIEWAQGYYFSKPKETTR